MGGLKGGVSLWAHMIGSLISAQLCPSNTTDQKTVCQQTQPFLCRRRDEVRFDGGVHLFFFINIICEHMSSQQVERSEVLLSEATDESADGGPRLCAVIKHMAQSTASGLRECV